MGTPIGECFEAQLNGVAKTYHVRPRVFSDDCVDALLRLRRKMIREEKFEALADIATREIEGEISKEVSSKLQEAVSNAFSQETAMNMDVGDRYQCAAEMLATRDGKAIALLKNCDEVDTIEHAYNIIDSAENTIEIMSALINAGQEGLESAGNSRPRSQTKSRGKK